MSAEWDNFMRDLNWLELERERFGSPPEAERPGSLADLHMRRQHKKQVDAFYRRARRRHTKKEQREGAVRARKAWLAKQSSLSLGT